MQICLLCQIQAVCPPTSLSVITFSVDEIKGGKVIRARAMDVGQQLKLETHHTAAVYVALQPRNSSSKNKMVLLHKKRK